MKLRLCDFCGRRIIKSEYIKCCLSKVENKKHTLTHEGDVCKDCWNVMYHGKGFIK